MRNNLIGNWSARKKNRTNTTEETQKVTWVFAQV